MWCGDCWNDFLFDRFGKVNVSHCQLCLGDVLTDVASDASR